MAEVLNMFFQKGPLTRYTGDSLMYVTWGNLMWLLFYTSMVLVL